MHFVSYFCTSVPHNGAFLEVAGCWGQERGEDVGIGVVCHNTLYCRSRVGNTGLKSVDGGNVCALESLSGVVLAAGNAGGTGLGGLGWNLHGPGDCLRNAAECDRTTGRAAPALGFSP